MESTLEPFRQARSEANSRTDRGCSDKWIRRERRRAGSLLYKLHETGEVKGTRSAISLQQRRADAVRRGL